MTIKIYTNMNNADLYVNGKFIKTLSGEKVLKCKIKCKCQLKNVVLWPLKM